MFSSSVETFQQLDAANGSEYQTVDRSEEDSCSLNSGLVTVNCVERTDKFCRSVLKKSITIRFR